MSALWEVPNRVDNYTLSCMSDAVLLELQVSTMRLPAFERTREDAQLLDRIGMVWRSRKAPALTIVKPPAPKPAWLYDREDGMT